eukprot:TRINITY_DN48147_c0_g1_i1.p1 TRINITY_DN48147_c0_g1~~TRINITY_DN48147_c0_g1_i1.p1  ORF type:complete len:483 (-),score=87.77 TRINITY_DN48147_c0_g1_i1:16-1464(-)
MSKQAPPEPLRRSSRLLARSAALLIKAEEGHLQSPRLEPSKPLPPAEQNTLVLPSTTPAPSASSSTVARHTCNQTLQHAAKDAPSAMPSDAPKLARKRSKGLHGSSRSKARRIAREPSPKFRGTGRMQQLVMRRATRLQAPSTGPLHAISVRQPHAFAIMCGQKDVENRSWLPTIKLPAFIAVHASGTRGPRSTELEAEEVVRQRLSNAGIKMPESKSLPRGALLGLAYVDSCLPPLTKNLGWALAGHQRWHISKVLSLSRPIPCSGQLGLWKVKQGHALGALRSLERKASLPGSKPCSRLSRKTPAAAAFQSEVKLKSKRVVLSRLTAKISTIQQQEAKGTASEAKVSCPICAGPLSSPCAASQDPISCQQCTSFLSEQRGLKFAAGQIVWCGGFGPLWPACIKTVGFTSNTDPRPYCVEFFGDHKYAWTSESRLRTWDPARGCSSSAHCDRRRQGLEAAMAEAQAALERSETESCKKEKN